MAAKAHNKPNIRMVAARARLSPATVSLALRGSESISPATRERALAAARELNYSPASRGRAPNVARVAQLLYVTKDFGDRPVTANPFYGEILSAAEQEALRLGMRLTFCLLSPEDRVEEQLASLVASHTPDGVLLVGAYPAHVVQQVADTVAAPMVLVDNIIPGVSCDTVMADDFYGALLATRHLIDLGHRQIGVAVGEYSPSLAARQRGYRAACTDAGLGMLPPTITVWDRPHMQASLEALFAQPDRPTALFCVTDYIAVYVMELLRDLGLRVPDDVSVVGFDNFPIARMAHPPLTTLANYPEVMGRIAVQRLISRIKGETLPGLNITVSTNLVIRESVRKIDL